MWLSNLKLVLPDRVIPRGALAVEDGLIADAIEGDPPGPSLDARGLTAVPGMIDMHGDMLEREILPRPKAEFPTDLALIEVDKRLASSGVTTAYAAVSFAWHKNDGIRSEERARQIMATVNEMRPVLLTDHYVHARFEITNPEAGGALTDLLNQRRVHLISIMDHTPGQGQYRDIERYIQFSIQWHKRQTGEDITGDHVKRQIEKAQQRPKAWDAVESIAKLAKEHGVVLASHDDDSVEKVAFLDSIGVSISEFPVTGAAGREARRRGIHIAMGAPNAFRGQSTTEGNLSASDAVAAGITDILATDYYPPAMLQAVYAIERRGILPLHEAVKLVAQNPAEALGFTDRGRIEPGLRADIALAEEGGRPRVRATLREGIPIYWDRYMADIADPLRLEGAGSALSA